MFDRHNKMKLKIFVQKSKFFFCCSDDFQCYVYMCLLYYYHSGFVYTQNNEDKTRQIKSPRSTNFEEKKRKHIHTHTHVHVLHQSSEIINRMKIIFC